MEVAMDRKWSGSLEARGDLAAGSCALLGGHVHVNAEQVLTR